MKKLKIKIKINNMKHVIFLVLHKKNLSQINEIFLTQAYAIM